jgi:selenide,water dikinase
LLEKDICRCAGERLGDQAGAIAVQLTRLVKNAGCASKIPPADLSRILSRLPVIEDPRLLVGAASADDAGVVQISPDLCLVQTVDVFAPSVDDPYTFGKIAAANSLSDVYAMGGKPLTALSIIGYPLSSLGDEAMYQMLRGGMEKLEEAGVLLVGGHSINDEEIKFGFSVTGLISPKKIITNAGARPGDALLLTKPLGTGIIAFASQIGAASESARQAAAESMMILNRSAAEIMLEFGAHAGTDVTGFGLLGHLYHIVRESRVGAELWWEAIPLLPEVHDYAAKGMISGAAERNREFAGRFVEAAAGVPEVGMDILYDPQTSGGLLFTLPENRARECVDNLSAAGCEAAVIGKITDFSLGRIMVKAEVDKNNQSLGQSPAAAASASPPSEKPCCEGGAGTASASDTGAAFQQFTSAALAPGALDAVQKEIITIALSVAVQCRDCLKIHLAKARAMGITPEEIQEAAMLGVMFGGCKAMMFWQEHAPGLKTNSGDMASKIKEA